MAYLGRAIETSIQSGQYFDHRGIRIAFYRWNVEKKPQNVNSYADSWVLLTKIPRYLKTYLKK